jgi:hypothetical protein
MAPITLIKIRALTQGRSFDAVFDTSINPGIPTIITLKKGA